VTGISKQEGIVNEERKSAPRVDEDVQDARGLPDAPDGSTGRPGPGYGLPSFDPLAPPILEPPFETRRGGAGGVPTTRDWKTDSTEDASKAESGEPAS